MFPYVTRSFRRASFLDRPTYPEKKTRMRDSIGPKERLCVCLCYLVTGDAQTTIAASYRVSPAVGRIIAETCELLWKTMIERGFLKMPCTVEDWKIIAHEFGKYWNFPNCIGALDGKHVVMQAPAKSGSVYFNYKKTFSIVLMAVCNARYEFTLVDIGDCGQQSDGSVYNCSNLGYAIENNKLNIPGPTSLPNSQKILPHVFVADDAFGLKPHMMKPFPFQNMPPDGRIFNYRLSRARRVIENTFGIAASRFRIFHRPIVASVEKVQAITKAVVALHNYLMRKNSLNACRYCPRNYIDQDSATGVTAGEWREKQSEISGLQPLKRVGSNNYSMDASFVRQQFKEYFNSEGAVEWQWELVDRTTTHNDRYLERLQSELT